jgi:hypothetical protein
MKNYAELPEPITHGNPKNDVGLGELLAMRGKPFKDWRDERKYLQKKWGKQGQLLKIDKSEDADNIILK